ncbi:MAG: DNA primase [Ignavibacteriaceae bacterium]|nr:DNA primase [Ignavibacteriaceae bacterium]
MRIPEQKVEEILHSADIVDFVGQFVQLRKRGKNYVGLCPFHNEKTPSFTVNSEKQIYYCFGCQEGGNVFKFLMSYKKISYVEAIQEIAGDLGINIEYEENKFGVQSETEVLFDINEEAARFFSNNLLKSAEGERGRLYFDNRKIKINSIRSFGLGYAQTKRDALVNHLLEKKIDIEKAIELGLIGRTDKGVLYDRFSNRLIFPIFSPNGRVIAFAGRVFETSDNMAKYINSPESKIYFKGRILYGLSHSKDEIRKLNSALLVEGYMDLISLHQHGIKNVVAVSGTALTEDQVQLLSRYTKNVVLLFDADNAGIKASMRSIEILLKQDMNIKIVSLPAGEDPDSFVQKFGKDEFLNCIQRAVNFLEYQFSIYESSGKFADPVSSTEAIRELVKPIGLISDELKRSMLIKSLAEKFNLREKLLESETEKVLKNLARETGRVDKTVSKEEALQLIDKSVSEREKELKPLLKLEKEILQILLEGKSSILDYIFENIDVEDFYLIEHKKIFELVRTMNQSVDYFNVNSLLAKLNDETLQKYCIELSVDKYRISDKWDSNNVIENEKSAIKHAKDLVRKIKLIPIEQSIRDNFEQIKSVKDEKLQIELMRENSELNQEKKFIEQKYS